MNNVVNEVVLLEGLSSTHFDDKVENRVHVSMQVRLADGAVIPAKVSLKPIEGIDVAALRQRFYASPRNVILTVEASFLSPESGLNLDAWGGYLLAYEFGMKGNKAS